MANHVFELFFTIDETVITRPDCGSAPLKLGDTVSFKSPHGKVEIAWNTASFDTPVYMDGTVATVTGVGPFNGICTITRPSGATLKYWGTEGVVDTGDAVGAGNTK